MDGRESERKRTPVRFRKPTQDSKIARVVRSIIESPFSIVGSFGAAFFTDESVAAERPTDPEKSIKRLRNHCAAPLAPSLFGTPIKT